MAELLDFLPLFTEDAVSIRARLDADVNAGIDPDNPSFVDTTEGGMYYDTTQPVVLEMERLWDLLATVYPASAFIAFAWGQYLDYHGQTLNVDRHAAVAATGTVTFTGTVGALIATNTQLSTLQTDADTAPPVFETTADATIPGGGTVDAPVVAAIAGSAGNVPPGTVVVLSSPNPGVTALTNAASISGGDEVETDDAYRVRLLLAWASPKGGGNQADYQRWGLDEPGVGHVTVQPNWDGAGTVRLVITDKENNPSSGTVVDSLQARLDPDPGEGLGQAPVGAVVTVATPTQVPVDVSATVTFSSGFNLDGSGGAIASEDALDEALAAYINTLDPGATVYYKHVQARFFSVPGVLDVSSLLLNGGSSNVSISGLEVAQMGSVALT